MPFIPTPDLRAIHAYIRERKHATLAHGKINKTALNFWLDIVLLILFIATGITAYTDKQLHQNLGLVMSVMIPLHLWTHWSWIKAIGMRMRQMKPHTRLKAILSLSMLLIFFLLVCSGMIIMLIWAPAVVSFHSLMVYAFVVLVASHIALNGKWLTSQIQRRLPGRPSVSRVPKTRIDGG